MFRSNFDLTMDYDTWPCDLCNFSEFAHNHRWNVGETLIHILSPFIFQVVSLSLPHQAKLTSLFFSFQVFAHIQSKNFTGYSPLLPWVSSEKHFLYVTSENSYALKWFSCFVTRRSITKMFPDKCLLFLSCKQKLFRKPWVKYFTSACSNPYSSTTSWIRLDISQLCSEVTLLDLIFFFLIQFPTILSADSLSVISDAAERMIWVL